MKKMICPECSGDGGWHIPWDIDRTSGALIEQWERCETCDETGEIGEDEFYSAITDWLKERGYKVTKNETEASLLQMLWQEAKRQT